VVGGRALDASRLRPGGGAFLTIRRTPADVRAARLKLASVLVSPDRRAEVQRLLVMVTSWAKRQDDVQAVGLAGSWARNAERMSSDIDLVVLTSLPGQYVHSAAWLVDFGSPEVIRTKQWGVVTERRPCSPPGWRSSSGSPSRPGRRSHRSTLEPTASFMMVYDRSSTQLNCSRGWSPPSIGADEPSLWSNAAPVPYELGSGPARRERAEPAGAPPEAARLSSTARPADAAVPAALGEIVIRRRVEQAFRDGGS
jgi:Streptomycin adenylyltransferase